MYVVESINLGSELRIVKDGAGPIRGKSLTQLT
jgi:hypothetical protein